MAQSLFQYGQIETTLIKAKEIRPFVERLITLARKGTLQSRQRLIAMLGDRSVISKEEQEKYDAMSGAQRQKVLTARSGRRHRAGKVPASYNKKTISFVAKSVVHQLISEVAPKFSDRPGGYTRIIRLPKRRIGDASDLAILQLVGQEEEKPKGLKKTVGQRRQKALDRVHFLEGKGGKRKGRGPQKKAPESGGKSSAAAKGEPGGQGSTEAGGGEKAG
jgi:large subunit ribosomal protein L17